MFHGSIVALVSPMTDSLELDLQAVDRLVGFHLSNGTAALVIGGTTGESAALKDTEPERLLDQVIERVDGRIPVIAGSGSPSTEKTLRQTRRAAELGADAALIVTPYYNRPTQEGLYRHYRLLAEAVDIPQILYNVPARTGVDLLPKTVARLAPLDNIVAIKEAVADPARVAELLVSCGDQLTVLSGDDGSACDSMLNGAQGVISVAANVAPQALSRLCEMAAAGSAEQARRLNDRLNVLYDALSVQVNPIPVKWALKKMGMIGDGIRLPLVPLQETYHRQVELALADLPLLD